MSAERRSVGEHYAVGEIQTAHRDGSFVVVEVWVPLGEAGSVELGARVGIVPKAHLSDAQALSRAFGPATLYEAARLSGGARVLARTIGGRNAAARATAETLAKALNDMGPDVDAHLAGED